jgi:DNA-binding NarL/FixJ family response regulator
LRLHERVRVAYLRDIGYKPVRRRGHDGKWCRRTAERLTVPLIGDVLVETRSSDFQMPVLGPRDQELVDMRMRGMTQQQIAWAWDQTEAAISNRMRKIRAKAQRCNRH